MTGAELSVLLISRSTKNRIPLNVSDAGSVSLSVRSALSTMMFKDRRKTDNVILKIKIISLDSGGPCVSDSSIEICGKSWNRR